MCMLFAQIDIFINVIENREEFTSRVLVNKKIYNGLIVLI